MRRHFDVAVFGAGPAGSASACFLARKGRTVLLVDERRRSSKMGENLPPAAHPILRELGVLDRINQSHLPSNGITSFWGSDSPSHLDFLQEPYGKGWQLDRTTFDRELQDVAVRTGAELCISNVRTVVREKRHFCFMLMGENVSCSWIVDATGKSSAIARQFGAIRERFDKLISIIACFRTEGEDSDRRLTIESGPIGWWSSTVIPGQRRIIALMTDVGLSRPASWLSSECFWNQVLLSHHIKQHLTDYSYEMVGLPCGADAGSSRLRQATGDRWIAVGDAAISFDPLSSWGIFGALRTAMLGSEAINQKMFGLSKAMENYQEALECLWRAYLAKLSYYYSLEKRWNTEFWDRRAGRW